jgi:hypothetical protein
MTDVPADLARDYHVVTRQERKSGTWAWEIRRRSAPLGVRLHRNGFVSEPAAKLAGEKELRRLLEGLVQDQG